MFIMHTGFAMGCPLAPLLAKNYLSQRTFSPESRLLPKVAIRTEDATWWLYGDDSQVEVPLAGVGAIFILLTCVFCVLDQEPSPRTTSGAPVEHSSWSSMCSPSEKSGVVMPYRRIVPMVALFYMALVAMETPLFGFLFPFTVESELRFSKQEAVYLDSVGKIAVLVSRVCSVIASRCLSIHAVLSISLLGSVFSIFGLEALGKHSTYYMWFFACSNGFFMSSLWPAGYSWAKQYVPVTGTMVGMWDVCAALSRVSVTWYAGYLYQFSSPYAIFSLSSFNASLALLSFSSMHMMQMRFMWKKPNHQIHSL